MPDEKIRITLYKNAMQHAYTQFSTYDGLHKSMSCFHALTTRFTAPPDDFRFYTMRDCVFGRFRDELAKLGKLKQVLLRAFDYAAVCGDVDLRFTSPIGVNLKVSDPWNASCKHSKNTVRDLQDRRGFSTSFKRYYRVDSGAEGDEDEDIPRFHIAMRLPRHQKWVECQDRPPCTINTITCIHCSRLFVRQFLKNPDLPVTVFVDGTQMSYVEVTFVDPGDGVSEWRYRFLHSGCPTNVDT